jgi:hypothetical protein
MAIATNIIISFAILILFNLFLLYLIYSVNDSISKYIGLLYIFGQIGVMYIQYDDVKKSADILSKSNMYGQYTGLIELTNTAKNTYLTYIIVSSLYLLIYIYMLFIHSKKPTMKSYNNSQTINNTR